MDKFTLITAKAAPMMAANTDTDVIMPKQFLKGIDRKGLDRGVFFDLRFNLDGTPNEKFILNQADWQGSQFLVVGPNFGCGSSREHAVWGLKQLGIRALIGTSFAGIFNDNCLRNGVLTICVSDQEIEQIATTVSNPATNTISVDLEGQKVLTENGEIAFDVDPLKKEMLIKGLDAVGFTLSMKDDILAFEQSYFKANPWLKL
ncbi:3-isopropylmalate dehydratase small subunit [[Mannheimia] succiniciproducens]|uniref:3-isopropylmalate dehydratase small subunit 1 n=1 Tax=Mannheimia succiniciproducens (strain KCTC 0769BP / MBEL55E) TaxID=221988 RepID=LEUD1_MANSM|nr:3-isopropylmalate dehydratase small subunit [[Mannheimia] succiniciproducens]Q65VR9.1 RecName: Full=3-isopropylmalate dehydratase small subunit 1; AltName: Full=Alpha-IPM isomerase 1; Short=IPMI 1; AltName: Full=Isopropylmalate isomerase 1 [[Mannheimia] succiniciproducens MBEL55E]AAU36941.1 LeuD protein [[Mannheimia] succiniciproducens MBEL55E]